MKLFNQQYLPVLIISIAILGGLVFYYSTKKENSAERMHHLKTKDLRLYDLTKPRFSNIKLVVLRGFENEMQRKGM